MAQALSQDLASQFRRFITTGRWEIGSQLPALRTLADEQGVSVNTARAAMQELAEESLIDWRHGRRGVVTALPAEENSIKRQGRPKHIGLVGLTTTNAGPEMDSWAGHMARAAENILARNSDAYLTRLISFAEESEKYVEQIIEQIAQFGSDMTGVIIFSAHNPYMRKMFDALDKRNIPWIAIGRPDTQLMHNFVSVDYLEDGKQIGQYFARRNHKTTWIVSPNPAKNVGWACTISGVYQGYVLSGQPTESLQYIESTNTSESAGYEAIAKELGYTTRFPQAIYAIGDYLAIGAIRALRQKGIDVPGDVEVIGGTGLDSSSHMYPPLTVLAQPMEEIGIKAAQMLLDIQQAEKQRCTGVKMLSKMIFRQTTVKKKDYKNDTQKIYKPEISFIENEKNNKDTNEALLAGAV